MVKASRPDPDEVEQLMRNAQLRDELEPYFDESVGMLSLRQMSTSTENEFLASMLAWERAPALPIAQWFSPEVVLPHPDSLTDGRLHEILWETINRLYEQRIVLDFTEHLSDRQLYCLIFRDILPSPEKKIDGPKNYLHWDCLDASSDPESWLRYYASVDERSDWHNETGQPLPPCETCPFPRVMPRRAL